MPYPTHFSVRSSTAVGVQLSVVEEGQLLKQAWTVGTHFARLAAAGYPYFGQLVDAQHIGAPDQTPPLP
jgi:hypothetical protein